MTIQYSRFVQKINRVAGFGLSKAQPSWTWTEQCVSAIDVALCLAEPFVTLISPSTHDARRTKAAYLLPFLGRYESLQNEAARSQPEGGWLIETELHVRR